MKASLIIQTGKLKGKRLKLTEQVMVIGREDDCEVKISSSHVSRRHSRLTLTEEGIYVEDLKSRNGTLVNGVPITQKILLQPGDLLQVGKMEFKVPDGLGGDSTTGKSTADEEIMDWLGEDTSHGTSSTGDTGIYPPREASASPFPEEDTQPKRPKFDPLNDPDAIEAADVIQQFWAKRKEQG